jgi:sialidase-1
VLSVAFLATSVLSVPAAADVISSTDLFVGPSGDYVTDRERYHTFRIPGMIVTADGTILAFCEARRGTGEDPRRDENAPIDLVFRRSTDNGRTWGPLAVVDSGFLSHGGQVDFSDPTPVLDTETGTVFLLYGQFPDLPGVPVTYGQSPEPGSGNHVVWVRSTTDNGHTWSGRKQVGYPDEPHETRDGLHWRHAEPGPGHGIQLRWQSADSRRNGRLLVPARRRGSRTPGGPESIDAFVFISDDHGETWHVGQLASGPTSDEQEVVELTDGRVLMDARQGEEDGDDDHRRRHVSADGGASWGPDIQGDIPVTPVDGSMVRYSAKRSGHDKDRILFSAPRGDSGLTRSNLTVWTSYDEGQTFTQPALLHRGFAAYSVLQRLADGTIGMLVETAQASGNYGGITFYRFDLGELESPDSSR